MRTEHVVQRLFGVGKRQRHDDAFARRQSVGFDDDRRALRANVLQRRRQFVEDVIACGRNVVPDEKFFREGFRTFELRGDLARAEATKTLAAKTIDESGNERRFGADDGQRDIFFFRQSEQSIDVVQRDIRIAHAGFARRARVAGSDDDFADAVGLLDLPRQRMFAAAGTDDENFHERILSGGSGARR